MRVLQYILLDSEKEPVIVLSSISCAKVKIDVMVFALLIDTSKLSDPRVCARVFFPNINPGLCMVIITA